MFNLTVKSFNMRTFATVRKLTSEVSPCRNDVRQLQRQHHETCGQASGSAVQRRVGRLSSQLTISHRAKPVRARCTRLIQAASDHRLYSQSKRCVYSCILYKKLSCRRETARRAVSVEILSTAAQLYEISHFKTLAIDTRPRKSLKVIGNGST